MSALDQLLQRSINTAATFGITSPPVAAPAAKPADKSDDGRAAFASLTLANTPDAGDAAQRVAVVFNGTYTIENTTTGDHRTFSIRTQKDDARFAPGKRIVALLTGPDNEADYTGFAFVDDRGVYVWRSKQGQPAKPSQFDVFASLIWSLATRGEKSIWYGRGYRLLMEGRCIRCNRKLTHPESIRTGIGPECAARVVAPKIEYGDDPQRTQ